MHIFTHYRFYLCRGVLLLALGAHYATPRDPIIVRPIEPQPQPEALAAEVGRRREGFARVHIATKVLGALHVGLFQWAALVVGFEYARFCILRLRVAPAAPY